MMALRARSTTPGCLLELALRNQQPWNASSSGLSSSPSRMGSFSLAGFLPFHLALMPSWVAASMAASTFLVMAVSLLGQMIQALYFLGDFSSMLDGSQMWA